MEENSNNIYFDETMIFSRPHLHKRLAVASSSCQDFSTFYDFGGIGVLRSSFEIHKYVSIVTSELSQSLSTLFWSNGH